MAWFLGACFLSACAGKRVRLGDGPLDSNELETGAATDSRDTDPSSATSPSPLPTTSNVDVGSSMPAPESDVSTSSTGGDSGSDCTSPAVAADEVIWIGDSWFTIPGNQRTRVEELARAAGALGADSIYESRAEAASNLAAVVQQYDAAKAGTAPRVLIMNGGTWDTILSNGSPSTVARVIVDFNEFLERVASEGFVQRVIYMLVPELPMIPGVAELRPGLFEVCSNSKVPCHFLDLQPLWEGHPEYTSVPDGIQASVQGATVIAEQIWSIMRRECVVQ